MGLGVKISNILIVKKHPMRQQKSITVKTTIVNTPIEKVWKYWNTPKHIANWAFASNDWLVPHAENDLRKSGKFKTRMESADGKQGFDFEGTYTNVLEYSKIEYIMSDKRKVSVEFADKNGTAKITETFDPENENSREVQKSGWQAILDNFKKYVEHN